MTQKLEETPRIPLAPLSRTSFLKNLTAMLSLPVVLTVCHFNPVLVEVIVYSSVTITINSVCDSYFLFVDLIIRVNDEEDLTSWFPTAGEVPRSFSGVQLLKRNDSLVVAFTNGMI